jgi:hypothetical protein
VPALFLIDGGLRLPRQEAGHGRTIVEHWRRDRPFRLFAERKLRERLGIDLGAKLSIGGDNGVPSELAQHVLEARPVSILGFPRR